MAPPLYSYELSNGDLPYFYALSKSDLEDAEIIENLEHSALYGNRAVRLHAALLLSEKGIGLGLKDLRNYRIVSEVCTNLLDAGFTESELLENLLESYYLQEDYESMIFTVNKYSDPSAPSTGSGTKKSGTAIISSPKIEYYKFLAKLYEGNSLTAEYFRELLVENSASELIMDAYTLIREFGINLPDSTAGLADFKIQLFKREYLSAGRSMIQILKNQKKTIIDTLDSGYIVDNVILTPVILDEMYRVAGASGKGPELLEFMEEFLIIPSRTGNDPDASSLSKNRFMEFLPASKRRSSCSCERKPMFFQALV